MVGGDKGGEVGGTYLSSGDNMRVLALIFIFVFLVMWGFFLVEVVGIDVFPNYPPIASEMEEELQKTGGWGR